MCVCVYNCIYNICVCALYVCVHVYVVYTCVGAGVCVCEDFTHHCSILISHQPLISL